MGWWGFGAWYGAGGAVAAVMFFYNVTIFFEVCGVLGCGYEGG